jgi:hypothetical protein
LRFPFDHQTKIPTTGRAGRAVGRAGGWRDAGGREAVGREAGCQEGPRYRPLLQGEQAFTPSLYRGNSLIITRPPPGNYRRTMPKDLWCSWGGGGFL